MSDLEPDWVINEVSRKDLKQLMRRDNRTGLMWFAGWLSLLGASGYVAWLSLGSWWAVPAFFIYGTIYCFAEPIAHECSHGTPFRDRRLNETIHFLVGLILFKERHYHRWMHARHHSHTIITGEDPEIQYPRPTNLWVFFVLEPFKIMNAKQFVGTLISHAFSRPTKNAEKWVPASEHTKLFFWSRVHLAIYVLLIGAVVWVQAWVVFLFVLGPRLYGGFIHNLFSSMQHAGLCDNVYDHRLNSRTVILSPLSSFLYWNMNYHLEHHMFPLVPFHALPALHALTREQNPRPYNGLYETYREILPTFFRQQTDPDYVVVPVLPRPE